MRQLPRDGACLRWRKWSFAEKQRLKESSKILLGILLNNFSEKAKRQNPGLKWSQKSSLWIDRYAKDVAVVMVLRAQENDYLIEAIRRPVIWQSILF